MVTGFAGTRATVDASAADWQTLLAEAVPEVPIGEGFVVDWSREEWFGGCYSALGPGDVLLLDRLAVGWRIALAGEHVLGAGTIDGAIESGEAAASKLRKFLMPSSAV